MLTQPIYNPDYAMQLNKEYEVFQAHCEHTYAKAGWEMRCIKCYRHQLEKPSLTEEIVRATLNHAQLP